MVSCKGPDATGADLAVSHAFELVAAAVPDDGSFAAAPFESSSS